MGQGKQPPGNLLLQELSELATLIRSNESINRLEILLSDYLVCMVSASESKSGAISPLNDDGILGRGAWMALQSNCGDRDDLDWSVGTHPGSVIWSTIISICLLREKARNNFLLSAQAGYRTSASMGNFLGVDHRSKWHVTGTAGSFAAASAASVSFNYSQEVHQRALQLAGANIGGSALAPREREGASAFNRSAATTLGITAAMAARAGAIAVENLWEGPYGILRNFSVSESPLGAALIADGVSTASLRLFPVTGFAQSSVLATARLAERNFDHLEALNIDLAGSAISLLDGSRGGFWWDVRAAVSAAWASKDPTNLYPNDEFLDRISLTAAELPLGAVRISIKTSSGNDSETIYSPPGNEFNNPQETKWREIKWRAMAGERLSEIVEVSRALIGGQNTMELWERVRGLVAKQ